MSKAMRLIGEAYFLSTGCKRGRPPGAKCFEVLGEILSCHTKGELWFPRGTAEPPPGLAVINNRADCARRLRDTYRLVKGSAVQGYTLTNCPQCEQPQCFGMQCAQQPRAAKARRTQRNRVAEHLVPATA